MVVVGEVKMKDLGDEILGERDGSGMDGKPYGLERITDLIKEGGPTEGNVPSTKD